MAQNSGLTSLLVTGAHESRSSVAVARTQSLWPPVVHTHDSNYSIFVKPCVFLLQLLLIIEDILFCVCRMLLLVAHVRDANPIELWMHWILPGGFASSIDITVGRLCWKEKGFCGKISESLCPLSFAARIVRRIFTQFLPICPEFKYPSFFPPLNT